MATTNEFAGTLAGFESLRELMGEDGIRELMGLFIDDGGNHIVRLGGALDRSDAGLLAEVAHALKGSSASVGANRMAQLCGQLETSGRAGTTAGGAAVLQALVEEFKCVTRFLSKTQIVADVSVRLAA